MIELLYIIAPHVIWAFVILHIVDEFIEQRRRETKTGEFEE